MKEKQRQNVKILRKIIKEIFQDKKQCKKVLEGIEKKGGLYYVVLSEGDCKNISAPSGRIFYYEPEVSQQVPH